MVIWVSLDSSRRELSNEYQYKGACVRVCKKWGFQTKSVCCVQLTTL